MAKKFQRKSFPSLKKQEEAILDRDLENFQGTKTELFFIKLSRKVSRNRRVVFGVFAGIVLIVSGVLGYFEYFQYKENKASEALESMKESWMNQLGITLDQKIEQIENWRKKEAYGSVRVWSAKVLADLYVAAKNYEKASELLEESAPLVRTYPEAKAYFYFLAGNYREKSGNLELALKNYSEVVRLLENNKETPLLLGWSLYHSARIEFAQGNLEQAKAKLEKVFSIEPGELGQDLTELKKQSTYLLLKISGMSP